MGYYMLCMWKTSKITYGDISILCNPQYIIYDTFKATKPENTFDSGTVQPWIAALVWLSYLTNENNKWHFQE